MPRAPPRTGSRPCCYAPIPTPDLQAEQAAWRRAGRTADSSNRCPPTCTCRPDHGRTAPVRPLLTDDLRALDVARIVDDDRASLSAREVLGLVEALRRHHAERSKRLAAILPEEAMRVVLDDGDAVPAGDLQDRVHFAPDAGIVHRNDRARPGGDEDLEPVLIEVQGVTADVDEDRCGATEDEGVDGRGEGERGHDDLIARPDVEQQRHQFQRMRPGGGEQNGRVTEQLAEQFLAASSEVAVAREVPAVERLGNVLVDEASVGRTVERDRERRAVTVRRPGFRWAPGRSRRGESEPITSRPPGDRKHTHSCPRGVPLSEHPHAQGYGAKVPRRGVGPP